ncbi:MAG TPA: PfkB family carbohydrate kinase, partial [Roseiflexaceae bacterium]
MPNLITSIGEILIDFLPIVERGETTGFRMHVGGSPYNVAMGVARLGQPVAFASKVATDFFGRHMRAHVEREGIDTRFLLNADAQSTLAFVAYEEGEPAYSFYGDSAADTLLSPGELPQALFDETRILHFGSI